MNKFFNKLHGVLPATVSSQIWDPQNSMFKGLRFEGLDEKIPSRKFRPQNDLETTVKKIFVLKKNRTTILDASELQHFTSKYMEELKTRVSFKQIYVDVASGQVTKYFTKSTWSFHQSAVGTLDFRRDVNSKCPGVMVEASDTSQVVFFGC